MMKARLSIVGVDLCMDDATWKLNSVILFADGICHHCRKVVKEFGTVCQIHILEVNVKIRRVMIFDRESVILKIHIE